MSDTSITTINGSKSCWDRLCKGSPSRNEAKKDYSFVIPTIAGVASLVMGVMGLVHFVQVGSLTTRAITMMATGAICGTLSAVSCLLLRSGKKFVVAIERTKIEGVEGFSVFGSKEWEYFFGKVGEQPKYPHGIVDLLNGQCPFTGEDMKKVCRLVLIPEKVNGKPLTLNYLNELVQKPKNGPESKYEEIGTLEESLKEKQSGPSHWVLMRDVIMGTYNTSYEEQKQIVEGKGFEPPETLEAAVCVFMQHVASEQPFFSDNPIRYTRCAEFQRLESLNRTIPINLGGFESKEGLRISCIDTSETNFDSDGIGAMKKFLPSKDL